ncbi:hypothetical protein HZC09_04060 [Candidatus Micrarchaeota archaeon]|nr:hypothetical protein [Candidatus Micrarchaeota archaeon]
MKKIMFLVLISAILFFGCTQLQTTNTSQTPTITPTMAPTQTTTTEAVAAKTSDGLKDCDSFLAPDEVKVLPTKAAAWAELCNNEAFDMSPIRKDFSVLPVRFAIIELFEAESSLVVGTVEAGSITPGDKVVITPGNIATEVERIELQGNNLGKAIVGEQVALVLKGVNRAVLGLPMGHVLGASSKPPVVFEEFTAQIKILKDDIAIGKSLVLHLHNIITSANVTEIIETRNPTSGKTLSRKPDAVKKGEVALVKIKVYKPVSAEKFEDYPSLGWFLLQDVGENLAVGVITAG